MDLATCWKQAKTETNDLNETIYCCFDLKINTCNCGYLVWFCLNFCMYLFKWLFNYFFWLNALHAWRIRPSCKLSSTPQMHNNACCGELKLRLNIPKKLLNRLPCKLVLQPNGNLHGEQNPSTFMTHLVHSNTIKFHSMDFHRILLTFSQYTQHNILLYFVHIILKSSWLVYNFTDIRLIVLFWPTYHNRNQENA